VWRFRGFGPSDASSNLARATIFLFVLVLEGGGGVSSSFGIVRHDSSELSTRVQVDSFRTGLHTIGKSFNVMVTSRALGPGVLDSSRTSRARVVVTKNHAQG